MIKRHERPRSVKDASRGGEVGGIVEKEGPIHVSNVMLLDPKDNKPTRVGVRRDKGGKRERFAKRSGACDLMEATATQTQAAPPPRLRERYEQEVLPALIKKFGYTTPMQAPTLTKITLNMGLGEAKQNNKMLEAAQEQLATIAGQQPERAPRPQVDRLLQGARGDAGRRLGDPAPGADVGVPRPPLLDRGAADPRLPRPQPALLRRPRQLLDGRQRAADLPRNRLRLDRRGPRSRHHDHDHGADRPRGLRAAARRWACRSPRRAVPAAPTRRSRGRRGGAAQRGGAPQGRGRGRPRSSSSKRRTPRPTPSRSPRTRGEEGEGDEGGDEAAESKRRRGEFRQWLRLRRRSVRAANPSSRPAATAAAAAAGGRAPYYRKFGLCRICLREAAHEGYIPGMTKSSW